MLVQQEGIVLNALKFKESSLIVKVFTPGFGVLTFIEKGVRSTKAKGRAGWFQPGVILEYVMNYQEHKNLHYFKEYKLAHIYQSGFIDVRKLAMLQFTIELLSKCLQENHEDEQLYRMVKNKLLQLDAELFNANFHIQFTIELMKYMGVFPRNNYSPTNLYFNLKDGSFVSAPVNNFVATKESSLLLYTALNNSKELKNGKERLSVLELLIQYLQFHVEDFKGIKSLEVLKVVLG